MVVVIKMKGLPWEATARDIRQFYRGLDIGEEDIHLAPSQEGKASGFAFACFHRDEDARKAMHRNGNFVGKRYIELVLSSQAEMEKILCEGVRRRRDTDDREYEESFGDEADGERRSNGLGENFRGSRDVVRRPRSRSPLRKSTDERGRSEDHIGPSHATDRNRNQRENSRIANDGFHGVSLSRTKLERQPRGKGVMRSDRRRDDDRIELRRTANREREGRGYRSEATSVSRRGSERGLKRDTLHNSRQESVEEDPAIAKSTWVSMKGLPYTVTEAEILEFFKGLQVHGVHFMTHASGSFAGRKNGEAFVEFKSIGDCIHGANRNRQFIRKRYVGVKRCSVEEVLNALQDSTKYDGSYQEMSFRVGTLTQDSALHSWGTFDGESRHLTSPEPSAPLNNIGINSLLNLTDMHSNVSMGMESQMTPLHQLATGANISVNDITAGCVIGIRNLPSTVSAEEILDFFYGFPIIPDSIRIHYLAPGRSSGDAMVTLPTSGEALSAIEQLNHKPVGKRKVQLFLV